MMTGISDDFARRFRQRVSPSSPGKHQVEHDQIDPPRLERPPHGPAIGNSRHTQPVLYQILAQQAPNLGVVIDDKNVIRRAPWRNSLMVPDEARERKVTQCVIWPFVAVRYQKVLS